MKRKSIAQVDLTTDKNWKEESDARTLADAAAIRKDKLRSIGAKAGAQRMIEAEQDRLSGLKSVAKVTIPSGKSRKKR